MIREIKYPRKCRFLDSSYSRKIVRVKISTYTVFPCICQLTLCSLSLLCQRCLMPLAARAITAKRYWSWRHSPAQKLVASLWNPQGAGSTVVTDIYLQVCVLVLNEYVYWCQLECYLLYSWIQCIPSTVQAVSHASSCPLVLYIWADEADTARSMLTELQANDMYMHVHLYCSLVVFHTMEQVSSG